MLEKWFPTPIWTFNLNLTDYVFENAVNYCLDLKKQSDGVKISNKGGWQSVGYNPNDLTKETNAMSSIFKEIESKFIHFKKDLAVQAKIDFCINFAWININHKGHYNELHFHSNCIFSGVFYLTNNNSPITFVKDKNLMSLTLSEVHSNFTTDISHEEVTYTPKRGDLLMFPAWLSHKVKPNDSNEPRISIAFNVGGKVSL